MLSFRWKTITIAARIEIGDWVLDASGLARAMQDQPIAASAAAEMERRYRKILKRGKRLAELDPVRRHAVRIQAKKLRYACEFFCSAFPGKKAARRARKIIAALGQLQDNLGELNDIAVHEGLTQRVAIALDGAGDRKARSADKAFAAGRLSGREEARAASVLRQSGRAYASLAKVRPSWQ